MHTKLSIVSTFAATEANIATTSLCSTLLPGPLYIPLNLQNRPSKRTIDVVEQDPLDPDPRTKQRQDNHRKALKERMLRWREEEHFADPLGAVRPDYLIVTEKNIVKLCQVHPSNMKLPSDIVSLLGEEDDWASEWSEKIFGVIKQFDTEYPVKTRKAYKKRKK